MFAGEELVSLCMAQRESQGWHREVEGEMLNRSVKTLVTAMTSAAVDDFEPARLAAQLRLTSGMLDVAVAECAACWTDPSVHACASL